MSSRLEWPEFSGEIEIDGEKIKWDRNSWNGLAIEIDHERHHIGGEPNDMERIRVAISAWRIAYKLGLAIGQAQKQNEFKKALGI